MPVLLVALLAGASVHGSFDHSAWDRVLKAHVNGSGEVDYAAIKRNAKDLEYYITLLGHASPANHPELFPSRADELAYWINAYNAFVTRGVVLRYPTASVRDLGILYGFFRRDDYVAGGVRMSLRLIENGILRKKYGDARIHFSIVCASLGCPMLAREAFTAGNLEALLEAQARRFSSQRRNVNVDLRRNSVTLSRIFDWYTKDFVASGSKRDLLAYIRRYLTPEKQRALAAMKNPEIGFFDYDWAINDPGSRTRSTDPLQHEAVHP
jgi:hypothetical protein